MVEQNPAQQPQHKVSLRMMRTLGVTAVVSGFLIVFVVQATRDRIAENRRQALEKAIFQVVPDAEFQLAFTIDKDRLRPAEEKSNENKVYAGYTPEGRLAGIAIEAAGQGYQDVVRILYGYRPENECLSGMTVLESRETPGLGDKIEKDRQFQENFECLDVRLAEGGSQLLHPIEFVKRDKKSEPWQIDAITGATISSRAVADMIARTAAEMLPAISAHLQALKEQGLRVASERQREIQD